MVTFPYSGLWPSHWSAYVFLLASPSVPAFHIDLFFCEPWGFPFQKCLVIMDVIVIIDHVFPTIYVAGLLNVFILLHCGTHTFILYGTGIYATLLISAS